MIFFFFLKGVLETQSPSSAFPFLHPGKSILTKRLRVAEPGRSHARQVVWGEGGTPRGRVVAAEGTADRRAGHTVPGLWLEQAAGEKSALSTEFEAEL